MVTIVLDLRSPATAGSCPSLDSGSVTTFSQKPTPRRGTQEDSDHIPVNMRGWQRPRQDPSSSCLTRHAPFNLSLPGFGFGWIGLRDWGLPVHSSFTNLSSYFWPHRISSQETVNQSESSWSTSKVSQWRKQLAVVSKVIIKSELLDTPFYSYNLLPAGGVRGTAPGLRHLSAGGPHRILLTLLRLFARCVFFCLFFSNIFFLRLPELFLVH